MQHRVELVAILGEYFASQNAGVWLDLFREHGIPCGPINTIPEVFADPQVISREMVVEIPHPTAGTVRLVGSPMKLSDTPVQYTRHPPLLGEHTVAVLGELGFTESDAALLREKGAV